MTGQVPAALVNVPNVQPEHAVYWDAFSDLSDDRAMGFGPGPIPWTAINQWAARHEIAGPQFDDLVTIIGRMDAVWLQHHADARKRDTKKS